MKTLALSLLFGLTIGASTHARNRLANAAKSKYYSRRRRTYTPRPPPPTCPPPKESSTEEYCYETESEDEYECSEEHCYIRTKCPPKTCCEKQKDRL